MDLSYILLFVIAILTIVYYYLIWPFNYWKKQGVESIPGAIPGFGNVLPVLLLRENISTVCNRVYKSCSPKLSMIGGYFIRKPMLIVRDLDLVKSVLVKDFQSFQYNMSQLNVELDPFLGKNPFFVGDKIWKESRANLVNSMSQKKLKILHRILHEVSIKFDKYLDEIVTKDNSVELEMKELYAKFTAELVANTAFGVEGQSFSANPDPQSFTATVERIFQPTLANLLKQMLTLYLPELANSLGVSFLPRKASDYFADTVRSIMRHRKETDTTVDDFLQMTIDGMDKPNEDDVTGLLSGFFFDAYDTTAAIAAFATSRLSYLPEIQEKARQQIHEVLDKYEGTLSYDALKELTYLDQIVYETIRLYPILGVSTKICSQKITLQGSDGQMCCLEPGHLVCIPVLSIHTDKKYWKDPDVFDPDRFGENRKNELTKFAFLPFGEGPRMCAGMRYGLMTVKTILALILRKFVLEHSTKNKMPIKLDQWTILTSAAEGLWAKLKKIDESK